MNNLIEFNQVGDPEVLELSQKEIPIPSDNELVIKVKAVGLNRAELLYMQGYYLFQPQFPSKVGMEAAGIVYDVGNDVDEFRKGDEVCLTPNIKMNEYGFLGEYVLVPKEAVIQKPQNLTFEQAAAIWVPYLTAYGGLVFNGGLVEGANQIVLISAASSSVGIAAIQLAKSFGATVIATTRSSAKKEYLHTQGADYIITTEEDISTKIQAITNGKSFEIAFDAIGGSFFLQLQEIAGHRARLVLYGLLSLTPPSVSIFPMAQKELEVTCFHTVFNLLQHPKRFREASIHILEELKKGNFLPTIDSVFTLPQTQEAYRYMMSGQQKGKIVIRI